MQMSAIESAEVIVPCSDLAASLAFFIDRLGFRLDLIFPADSPTTAVISGYGTRLRLEAATTISPLGMGMGIGMGLRGNFSSSPIPKTLTSPDGVTITFLDSNADVFIPPGTQEWIVCRNEGEQSWRTGRASMQYRDLIPSRLGGRFVASHIRIPNGGAVPDYVHFHRVRFQMIYCKTGWVRVVYEDQGEPFVMHAGDCVLQPPRIRHRVLEASAGMEVIELGCPAIHDTVADHELTLPNGAVNPQRDFSGQRFVRHVAANAVWLQNSAQDLEVCDLGIAAVTSNLARAQIWRGVRARKTLFEPQARKPHTNELAFFFLLAGKLSVSVDGLGEHQLSEGDSFVVPAGVAHRFVLAAGAELLEVSI
jgi:quercetin dioxygenase-like cupin family protein